MRALQGTGTQEGLAGDGPGSTVFLEQIAVSQCPETCNCLQRESFLMRALQETGTLTGFAGDEPGSTRLP